MNKKKATNIRVELETKAKLDKCIILKSDTYDVIIRRILSEERHLPALKRAYEKAIETSEAFKKCETDNPTERRQITEQAKTANEYLMTVIRNFIKHVEAR